VLEEECTTLLREVQLKQEMESQYAKRGSKQTRSIKEAGSKVESLEKSMGLMMADFKNEMSALKVRQSPSLRRGPEGVKRGSRWCQKGVQRASKRGPEGVRRWPRGCQKGVQRGCQKAVQGVSEGGPGGVRKGPTGCQKGVQRGSDDGKLQCGDERAKGASTVLAFLFLFQN
jgi:hypothetical protein